MLGKADLIAFEADIAAAFNRGEIRAPIHLSGNNEDQLIAYFADNYRADRGDWVCTTWRSHYHCLLAGVPADDIRAAIMDGRSITLTFPAHRVVSSAIVGGILPIALGLALGVRLRGETAVVHVFVGDMTARTGAYHETSNYALGHDLPIHFIVEDNDKSVMTDTQEAWGSSIVNTTEEHRYYYELPFPHAGAGRRVDF